jgi:predicted RNA-binding Zn ribbon-like protein
VNFNSHADAVISLAAEFVNLLTAGESRGRAYQPPVGADRPQQLNALFRATGRSSDITAAQAAEFSPVADRLRTVFESLAAGDVDDAARRVNELLGETGAHPVLQRHDGEPWHLHFHAADEGSKARGWAAGCVTGLAIVLGGEHADRLGVCLAPHCDRVYVDSSRNGSKRFCSTACQNRVKAAAFRERHGQPPVSAADGLPGDQERDQDVGEPAEAALPSPK